MNHIIVGTAGHVDHGKTALIKSLTGQDADRLPEEKRRGLTIDLGFAFCDLSGSIRAGFVDVPGHERFIANMTGGVGGMDAVLFVVAADEGMKPQSYEHLDILQILGVQTGIVVISRTDLADRSMIDAVREQIRQETAGTFLENAPVIEVSNLDGSGIEDVRSHLLAAAEYLFKEKRTRDRSGVSSEIPRLPIDRVFTVGGFGTVVTGTLLSGEIKRDSRIMLMPSGLPCRIRGMQSYGEQTAYARAGQRLALNLSNVGTGQISRGDVITAAEGTDVVRTECLNVSLVAAQHTTRQFESGMRVHVLIGTARTTGRLFLFRSASAFGQLRLDEPVCAAGGDRFILRFFSPMTTIGGGAVIEADAYKCRVSDQKTIERLRRKAEGYEETSEETAGRAVPVEPSCGEMPKNLKKTADRVLSIYSEAGFRLVSVNSFDQDELDEKTVRMALRELKKRGRIVQIDENHYTTGEIAEQAVGMIRGILSNQGGMSIADLRDALDTNRKSARLFLEYTDRKRITRMRGGAATREAVP